MGVASGDWTTQIVTQLALAALAFAGAQVQLLLSAFGSSTEPDFGSVASSYGEMLAIALLLSGAVIACALIERILGGQQGAGWSVIPRTVMCVALAVCGIQIVQYLAHYADLLANVWFLPTTSGQDSHGILAAWGIDSQQTASSFVTKNVWNLLLLGFFAGILAFFVYLELVIRGALILLLTLFIPLVCVMGIWPRLTASAVHLAEFLVGLLLSKFVLATAVALGFGLLIKGLFVQHTGSPTQGLATGIALLLIAAFSPVVLVQGLRFTHSAAGQASRRWVATGVSLPSYANAALRAGSRALPLDGVRKGAARFGSAVMSRLPRIRR